MRFARASGAFSLSANVTPNVNQHRGAALNLELANIGAAAMHWLSRFGTPFDATLGDGTQDVPRAAGESYREFINANATKINPAPK